MANEEDEVQVAYRISKSVARAMDKEIDRREREQPGIRITRAELSRVAMLKLLSGQVAATDAESTGPKRKVS